MSNSPKMFSEFYSSHDNERVIGATVPKQGEYEIAVQIYEPNKDQAEAPTSVYKKF